MPRDGGSGPDKENGKGSHSFEREMKEKSNPHEKKTSILGHRITAGITVLARPN